MLILISQLQLNTIELTQHEGTLVLLAILDLAEYSVDKKVLFCSVIEVAELMQVVIKFCKTGTCINLFHFFAVQYLLKHIYYFKNGNT